MAVEFELESIDGIALGIARGPLSLREIKQAAEDMWERASGDEIRMLWDLREARFNLDTNEIRDLSGFVKRLVGTVGLRTAFLVARDLEFGLLRMFEAFREAEGAENSVFRDQDSAVAWLNGPGA